MPTAQEPQIRAAFRTPGNTDASSPAQPVPAAAADHIAGRVAANEPAPPEPDGPVGLLLVEYLHGQFLALLREDPRVRAHDADAIHKMRVSTRRMRSALASYRKVLAPEQVREVRDELKWLAGVLGNARDAQVMRARLQSLAEAQPAELVMGPVRRRIDEELLGDYQAAHALVLQALDGDRYRSLLEQLEIVVTKPDFTPEADAPAARTAARMLRRDRKRLHRQVRDARTAGSDDLRSESLHEARKDAKRLRYAAEVAQPVCTEGSAELAAGAEHIQKILGEHQDSVVSREYLRRLGAEAAGAGRNGFTYGLMYAVEEERGRTARKRFRKAWAGFPRVV